MRHIVKRSDSDFKKSFLVNDDSNIPPSGTIYNFTSCSDYKSIIHVTFTNPAGLGDRAYIFEAFGGLATWLCATLITPPPEIWLHTKHNNNYDVSNSLDWSKYLMTVRRSDQSTFLGNASDLLRSKLCQNITTLSNSTLFDTSLEEAYKIVQSSTLSENLKEAYHIVQTGGCFRWEIDISFWKMRRFMQEELDKYPRSPRFDPYSTACQLHSYVSVSTSLFVQRAALAIAPKVPYSSLHIRQRGLEEKRSLTAPIIINYTRCVKKYAPPTKILIVFTDTTNPPFVSKLNKFLQLQWKHVIWGDQVIRRRYRKITKNDNYMTYAIASTVIGNSAVQLSTGKKKFPQGYLPCQTYANCHPCARENFRGTSEVKKLRCASCPKDPLCMEK